MISGIRIMSWNHRPRTPIGLTGLLQAVIRPRSGWPMPGVGAVGAGAATAGAAAALLRGSIRGRRGAAARGVRRGGCAERGAAGVGEGRGGRHPEGGGNGEQLEKDLHLGPCGPPRQAAGFGRPGAPAPAL